MDCTVCKKDRRLERAKSKNWSSSTWRKNPVRRLLSHSRPLQPRRYVKTGKIILCTLSTNVIALAPWLTMLRHQAAKNSVITSGAAKKVLFSSRDNCNCLILKQFERTSYFLGIQAWVLRQNGKQKKYARKSSQRSTFSFLISLFFIISQNTCLNFFETAFELLLYRKYGKKVYAIQVKCIFLFPFTWHWAWYDDVMNWTIFALYEYCPNLVQLKHTCAEL